MEAPLDGGSPLDGCDFFAAEGFIRHLSTFDDEAVAWGSGTGRGLSSQFGAVAATAASAASALREIASARGASGKLVSVSPLAAPEPRRPAVVARQLCVGFRSPRASTGLVYFALRRDSGGTSVKTQDMGSCSICLLFPTSG